MERNSTPSLVAPKIETARRRTGRVARKVSKAGAVARKRLAAISVRVKALRRQLQRNTEGFKYDLP
jgi:hypothetical protein